MRPGSAEWYHHELTMRHAQQQVLSMHALAASTASRLASNTVYQTGRLTDAAAHDSGFLVDYTTQIVEIDGITVDTASMHFADIPGRFGTALSVVGTLAVSGGVQQPIGYNGGGQHPHLWWWLETSLDAEYWSPLYRPASSQYVVLPNAASGHGTIHMSAPFGDFLRIGIGAKGSQRTDQPWGPGAWTAGTLTLGVLRL
jgi:hypothetical protein